MKHKLLAFLLLSTSSAFANGLSYETENAAAPFLFIECSTQTSDRTINIGIYGDKKESERLGHGYTAYVTADNRSTAQSERKIIHNVFRLSAGSYDTLEFANGSGTYAFSLSLPKNRNRNNGTVYLGNRTRKIIDNEKVTCSRHYPLNTRL